MTLINGYWIAISQWNSIVLCALSLYENGLLDDEQDLDYRCAEISETLKGMSENTSTGELECSQYDPQVDALLEIFDDEIIMGFILHGEENNWEFKS